MTAKLVSFIVSLIMILSASVFGLESADHEATEGLNESQLPGVSQSLQEFVDSALIYVQDNGKERALEEFNNVSGQFVLEDGRYYLCLRVRWNISCQPLQTWDNGRKPDRLSG